MKYPKFLININNTSVPILGKVFNKKTASFLIRLDDFVCKYKKSYYGILFIITKDKRYYVESKKNSDISVDEIVNFTVPYHYIKKK